MAETFRHSEVEEEEVQQGTIINRRKPKKWGLYHPEEGRSDRGNREAKPEDTGTAIAVQDDAEKEPPIRRSSLTRRFSDGLKYRRRTEWKKSLETPVTLCFI